MRAAPSSSCERVARVSARLVASVWGPPAPRRVSAGPPSMWLNMRSPASPRRVCVGAAHSSSRVRRAAHSSCVRRDRHAWLSFVQRIVSIMHARSLTVR